MNLLNNSFPFMGTFPWVEIHWNTNPIFAVNLPYDLMV